MADKNHFSVEYAIRHTGVLLQWLWESLHLWHSKSTGSGIGRPLLVVKVLHTRGKAKERQIQLVMTYFCGSVIWITKNKQHNCDIVDYIIQQWGKNKQWYACMQVDESCTDVLPVLSDSDSLNHGNGIKFAKRSKWDLGNNSLTIYFRQMLSEVNTVVTGDIHNYFHPIQIQQSQQSTQEESMVITTQMEERKGPVNHFTCNMVTSLFHHLPHTSPWNHL